MQRIFFRLFGPVLFLIVGTGCATTADVTYRSYPEGAVIVEQGTGRQAGMAPAELYYDWTPHRSGCNLIRGVTATWVSGVTVSTPRQQRICGGVGNYEIQLTRPSGASGFEKDMQFALQLQQTRAIEKQAEAAEGMMFMQMFNNSYKPRKKLSCTSHAVGNMLMTDCY